MELPFHEKEVSSTEDNQVTGWDMNWSLKIMQLFHTEEIQR